VRESCIHYIRLALDGWTGAMLDQFKSQIQTAIAVRLWLNHHLVAELTDVALRVDRRA
jgi:hypothetical protein